MSVIHFLKCRCLGLFEMPQGHLRHPRVSGKHDKGPMRRPHPFEDTAKWEALPTSGNIKYLHRGN